MRIPSTGETLGLVTSLAFAAALGACGTRSEGTTASASASHETDIEATAGAQPSMRVIGATVINGYDSAGRAVGVRSYAGPENPRAIGIYPEGGRIGVLCLADGRTITDKDVPAGHSPVVSNKYYLLNTSMEDWMGNGYVKVDGGAGVPVCPENVIPTAPVTVAPQETK